LLLICAMAVVFVTDKLTKPISMLSVKSQQIVANIGGDRLLEGVNIEMTKGGEGSALGFQVEEATSLQQKFVAMMQAIEQSRSNQQQQRSGLVPNPFKTNGTLQVPQQTTQALLTLTGEGETSGTPSAPPLVSGNGQTAAQPESVSASAIDLVSRSNGQFIAASDSSQQQQPGVQLGRGLAGDDFKEADEPS